jgi:hypothetical protein
MDHVAYAGAVCPASDLTARLEGELRRARQDLSIAEACYSCAAERALAAGEPVPFAPRRALARCRRQLSVLVRILAGVSFTGDCNVELA